MWNGLLLEEEGFNQLFVLVELFVLDECGKSVSHSNLKYLIVDDLIHLFI